MNKQRLLLVVSGPSGVGKDSVVQAMLSRHAGHPGGIEVSVSATTRQPGPGEVDGEHYHFLSRDEFEAYIEADAFREYAEYNGRYYGTLKREVDDRLDAGTTCVLVIEVKGAANIKEQYPECTTVFILPPSIEVLERRIRGRGRETAEQAERRIRVAEDVELPMAGSYDYRIVNNDLNTCADELYDILVKRQSDC